MLDWRTAQKTQRVALQPRSDFVLCLDADILLAWHRYAPCAGEAQTHFGCVRRVDVVFDIGDGTL